MEPEQPAASVPAPFAAEVAAFPEAAALPAAGSEIGNVHPDAGPVELHNLLMLGLHQMVVRVGWIFKTESVIMPAFFDAVSGSDWARSWLPTLNRLGQSLAPLLHARQLDRARRKKWFLTAWTVGMGLCFLLTALAWTQHASGPNTLLAGVLFTPCLLTVYAVFSACVGLNALALGTLQGKLIIPTRRGRLMGASVFLGAILAIGCAVLWLGPWLALPDGGYGKIFTFTGCCFVAAAVLTALVKEPASQVVQADGTERTGLGAALQVWKSDARFRRFALVAMLSGGSQLLFPHYQALARELLGLAGKDLMAWVIAQNAATGLGGLMLGPVADRFGNRMTLRIALAIMSIGPLAAIALAYFNPTLGRGFFWMVFLPIGLTPLGLKVMVNYTLEIAPLESHPRYLSTLYLCLALPYALAPLVGMLIQWLGIVPVFLLCAGSILLSCAGTWVIPEPRLSKHAA